MICLSILGLALAYSVLRAGGVSHQDWCITALAAGLAGLLVRRGNAGPLKGPIFWSAALLPCYVAFQMIPLPAGVLASVSRASAELAGSAAPLLQDVKFASISVATALTAEHLLRITTCTLVFLLVREIAARHPDRLWTLACPITIIAALEAAFGIMQVQSGNQPEAAGTWANRNHFAGFLEMALPFPVMYAVTALRRGRRRDQAPLGPAFAACFSLSIAALLLIAITQSLSRMGCAAALLGLCICGAGAIAGALKRHRTRVPARLALVVSAGTLAALLFVSAAPDRLIARFGQTGLANGSAAQDRIPIWTDTLSLIAAYPVFGCGFGTYPSAFSKYKVSLPELKDEQAHNDYLQLFAELGAAGFALVSVLAVAVLRSLLVSVKRRTGPGGGALAIACLAALAAIVLHGTVDFNLYIPSNAMLLAWICGIACSLEFAPKRLPLRPSVPEVIEVHAVSLDVSQTGKAV